MTSNKDLEAVKDIFSKLQDEAKDADDKPQVDLLRGILSEVQKDIDKEEPTK